MTTEEIRKWIGRLPRIDGEKPGGESLHSATTFYKTVFDQYADRRPWEQVTLAVTHHEALTWLVKYGPHVITELMARVDELTAEIEALKDAAKQLDLGF